MNRFYCRCENISKDKIIIQDKDELHHARNVLRLKTKDSLVVFDDKGNEYAALVEDISIKSMVLKIKEKQKSLVTQKFSLTIGCALPKKAKFDDIIDKLTQLGVDRIIPMLTERVVLRLDKEKKDSRQKRWKKIALNSCKQCQRNTIPLIDPVKDFKTVVEESRVFDLKLIPTLPERQKTLRDVLSAVKPRKILILIGPEGDFTPQEADLAIKAGFIPVTLGELVLRVETAAIYVASVFNYELK